MVGHPMSLIYNIYNMKNEFYHILNRGVDKRNIFMNDKDSFRFIHDLFEFNDVNNVDHNSHRILKKPASQLRDIGCPSIGNFVFKKENFLL